jgi:hypothetical protein
MHSRATVNSRLVNYIATAPVCTWERVHTHTSCAVSQQVPITFTTGKSFVNLAVGQFHNLTIWFRTSYTNVLLFQQMSNAGHLLRATIEHGQDARMHTTMWIHM